LEIICLSDTHELHRDVRVSDGVMSLIDAANDLRNANSADTCLASTLPSQIGSGVIGIRAVRAIASETFFAVALTQRILAEQHPQGEVNAQLCREPALP
jgi:hypothetical protein